jgi:hypothetical protein
MCFPLYYKSKVVYMDNVALLLWPDILSILAKRISIDNLYGVPYVMELLTDSDERVDLCKGLEVVFSGGFPFQSSLATSLVEVASTSLAKMAAEKVNWWTAISNSAKSRLGLPAASCDCTTLLWESHDSETHIYDLVVLEGCPSRLL